MAAAGEGKQTADSLDFLDIVFTVMLTVGLTPEALNHDHFRGLFSEPYFVSILEGKEPSPLTKENYQRLGTLLVGSVTLLLSWFGVRASLKTKQIQFDRVPGMFRFILDVALIVLYGIILICFKRLDVVLLLLFVVYFLYVVWDVFKICEYWTEFMSASEQRRKNIREKAKTIWIKGGRQENHDLDDWLEAERKLDTLERQSRGRARFSDLWATFNRQFISLQFAFWFALLYWVWPLDRVWSALLLAAVFTVLYRVAKIYPVRGSICAVASFAAVVIVGCIYRF